MGLGDYCQGEIAASGRFACKAHIYSTGVRISENMAFSLLTMTFI